MSSRENVNLTFLSAVLLSVKLQKSGIHGDNLLKIREIGDYVMLFLADISSFALIATNSTTGVKKCSLTPSDTRAPTIGGRIKAEMVPGVFVMPMRIPA